MILLMRLFRRKKIVVPPIDNLIWENLVTKKRIIYMGTLGAKVLLIRQQLKIANLKTDETIKQSAEEFRNYFVKNANIPKVKKDLITIIKLSEETK